jgi:tetratricopeptide (TPR) repeat protein
MKTGHLEKAGRLLRKSLELDPESESAHQLLTLVSSERSEQRLAKHHSRQGLRIAPEDSISHAAESARLLRSGRPFAARRVALEALRLDPDDEHLRGLYLEADKCSRLIYLPMYYWSLVVGRIPGGAITVWALFIALSYGGRSIGVPPLVLGTVGIAYLALVIYTWFAGLLVSGWLKLRPPQ